MYVYIVGWLIIKLINKALILHIFFMMRIFEYYFLSYFKYKIHRWPQPQYYVVEHCPLVHLKLYTLSLSSLLPYFWKHCDFSFLLYLMILGSLCKWDHPVFIFLYFEWQNSLMIMCVAVTNDKISLFFKDWIIF